MMTDWRPVTGYEEYYSVSNAGVIWSEYIKRPLVQSVSKTGYASVELRKFGQGKRVLIHRVVATAFIPNPDHKPEVNHKDGNKLNNRAENLEWCNASENAIHAFDVGLRKPYSHWKGKSLDEGHKQKVVAALRKAGFVPRKVVVDTATGIKYPSAKVAATVIGMGYSNLKGMLNGNLKNKTTLKYEGIHQAN